MSEPHSSATPRDAEGSSAGSRLLVGAPLEQLAFCLGAALVLVYAWLLDDAFVYFRYVDNLLFLDLGLVYNDGEYVEGFSSPFWTLLLIPLRATGLDYWLLVRAIGLISFVAFGLLLVRLQRAFVPPGEARGVPILNLPLAFLALNYGVDSYFTSGVESPLILVLAACHALFVMRPGSRALQIALGVSPLVRPELLIPLLLAIGWSWWKTKRVPCWAIGVAFVSNAAWLLFRVYYYADLLPNTFYLKDTTDYAQGIAYLLDTVQAYHVIPLLLAGAAATLLLRRGSSSEPRTRPGLHLSERFVMLALALPVLFYVVRIGGDPRHFRYLIFPFCLVVCSLGGLPELLFQRYARAGSAWMLRVIGIAFIVFSASLHPSQLSGHPIFPNQEHRTVAKINDAYGHRMGIRHEDWAPHARAEAQRAYRNRLGEAFAYTGIEDTWVCVESYMQFDKRIINNLGLTDAILARTNMKSDRPAHKFGLYPLAADLRRIQLADSEIGRGMYRRAVEAGRAPDWIANNLETIEVIEQKIYNRHDLAENVALALTFPDRIDP